MLQNGFIYFWTPKSWHFIQKNKCYFPKKYWIWGFETFLSRKIFLYLWLLFELILALLTFRDKGVKCKSISRAFSKTKNVGCSNYHCKFEIWPALFKFSISFFISETWTLESWLAAVRPSLSQSAKRLEIENFECCSSWTSQFTQFLKEIENWIFEYYLRLLPNISLFIKQLVNWDFWSPAFLFC